MISTYSDILWEVAVVEKDGKLRRVEVVVCLRTVGTGLVPTSLGAGTGDGLTGDADTLARASPRGLGESSTGLASAVASRGTADFACGSLTGEDTRISKAQTNWVSFATGDPMSDSSSLEDCSSSGTMLVGERPPIDPSPASFGSVPP